MNPTLVKSAEREDADKKIVVYTPRHDPGFSDRLSHTLDFIGIDETNKRSTTGRFMHMSRSSGRTVYLKDAPPKRMDNFDKLVDSLLLKIKEAKNLDIPRQALVDYLLYNKKCPFEHKAKGVILSNDAEKGFIAHIGLMINLIAKPKGIDLIKEFDMNQLDSIIGEVMRYCDRKNVNPKELSPELEKIVLHILELER